MGKGNGYQPQGSSSHNKEVTRPLHLSLLAFAAAFVFSTCFQFQQLLFHPQPAGEPAQRTC
jgi:hypothetical protein